MIEALVWLLIVLWFTVLSVVSISYWKTPIALWTAATFRTSGEPSRAFGELGAYYKLKGDNHTAEIHLREAIRLNPKFGPALNNLAWICFDSGRTEEAIELLIQCTTQSPKYALGWHDLGLFYGRTNQPEKAEKCFKESIRVEPQMQRSVNRLGLLAFSRQQFEEAMIWFSRALTLNPGHFEYEYNRAVTKKHMGQDPSEDFNKLPKPCPITPDMIPLEFAR